MTEAEKDRTTAELEGYSELLKAIANPARLRILSGLREDECNVGKMQKVLGLPQSTVSQHLSVLRSHGIIKGRREGTKMCYRIIDSRVPVILDALKND